MSRNAIVVIVILFSAALCDCMPSRLMSSVHDAGVWLQILWCIDIDGYVCFAE